MLKRIDQFIASADFLPPSFQLLPRLLLLLEDIEANADELSSLIRVDPGLTADILRVCNSAAYASAYPAETIQEAILRLGFREVHRVIMTVIASPVLKAPEGPYPSREPELWNHSLAAATASQFVAASTRVDAEIAFTSALLHDIGKMILARTISDEFSAAVAYGTERRMPVYEVERLRYKTDHAQVGARLLDRWGFPKNISTAVQYHHEPAATRTDRALASTVYLANILSYRITDATVLPEYVLFPDARILRESGFTQPELESCVPEAREEFLKLAERFR